LLPSIAIARGQVPDPVEKLLSRGWPVAADAGELARRASSSAATRAPAPEIQFDCLLKFASLWSLA
jgi:hypothetical protein